MFFQVETCRETLMTLSLTDCENANTNSDAIMKTTKVNDEGEEAHETGGQRDGDNQDSHRKKVKANESLDDGVHSAGNSTDDQLAADGATMSTDDSDHDVSMPLPQTTPDENANSKY